MYICTHTHIYVYIYITIYLTIYMYIYIYNTHTNWVTWKTVCACPVSGWVYAESHASPPASRAAVATKPRPTPSPSE